MTTRLVLAALALTFAPRPAPATPAPAVALSDTGLFAPVAAQQAERLASLDAMGRKQPSPAAVNLLVAAGRVDEAARLLHLLAGDPREVALASLRVHMSRLDFEAARPLAEQIAARAEKSDAERHALFTWAFLHDDAPQVDRRTRGVSLAPGTTAGLPELLAAGRLAYDMLDFARSDSCYTRALERATAGGADAFAQAARVEALTGLGKVAYRRRDYDGSLERHREAVTLGATADALRWLAETLIRHGRTDETISAAEWAVRLSPYHEGAHYYLGNGYARKNYTQLAAAYPAAFADAAGRRTLARADSLLAAGDRAGARKTYESVAQGPKPVKAADQPARLLDAPPAWADACVRLASLEFEDGNFARARDLCFQALAACPEYGRAHATLAKALESQRFAVDVHRADYEKRFAAAPMPSVPGIERFVTNWASLSPRHQKRVALSVAPWKQFIPVLVAGGSTYYIKPLWQKLSESPGLETLADTRINYDSRLWDDVRGAGGYHTVTGIEDVERTIFDKYNTVLHELSHQVHAVLTADQSREIQERYVQAKARDDSTKNGYLSRYASGSVYEYFAEGANAIMSPRRDAYDSREETRERLDAIDPDLRELVKRFMALADVEASYPVAFTNAGDDQLGRGKVDAAVTWYRKALERSSKEETALVSLTRALTLGNRGAEAIRAADAAAAAHPASGQVVTVGAEARWHGGRPLAEVTAGLERARAAVRAEDRYQVDLQLAQSHWTMGDAAKALAAADSVLAYQSDQPEGLWSRAAALGLARRWDEAFAAYDRAVRMRTGVVELRCDYARDLLRAGKVDAARAQLAEAKLLDEEYPVAEALRGWAERAAGNRDAARKHAEQALAWGSWCDLGRIVLAAAERDAGRADASRAALAPVRERIAKALPPEYVFREKLSSWESVHELPAVEREMLKELEGK